MKNVKAEKPHYALLATDEPDAPVVDAGDGDASIQLGNVIVWFDSRGDRESDPRVQAWRLSIVDTIIAEEVELEKSDEAYREKASQAKAIIEGQEYDPVIHDFIEIEVRHKDMDPVEVAQSIVDAAQTANDAAREKLKEKEEKRVEKREKQRERLKDKDPKDPKDPKDKG